MAHLRYLDESERIQIKALDTEHFVIGRAATCQLVFDDDMTSREHVRIDLEGDSRFRIRDLGSRNKTFVNGEPITETLLTAGDVIRVGDHVVEFIDDEAEHRTLDLEFLTPDRTEPPNCEWIKVKAPLSLTGAQIEQLALLGSDQALTARPEDIASAALGRILLDLQADRGLIALRGSGKTDLRPLAHRALSRTTGGSMTPVSQSFVLASLLQSVAGRYPQTSSQLDGTLGFAITAVVAPLMYRREVVGTLYVDRPVGNRMFTSAALQYCAAAGAHVGSILGESSRQLARTASQEGAAWVATLRRMQALLATPVTSGESFDVALKYIPGRLRCGDFGDVVHVDEARCFVLVIDGGGHGIAGISQACAIRTAIRAAISVSDDAVTDPADVFNALNRMMAESRARQVLPCTYVGIDISAGKAVYINAGGMPPLLLVAPGRLVTLDQPSLVLGVDAAYHYEATRVDLPEAFRLVCHTDGLTEATGLGGEPLGDAHLHETLLERQAFASASDLLVRIDQAWKTHLAESQPDDDALVLALGRG